MATITESATLGGKKIKFRHHIHEAVFECVKNCNVYKAPFFTAGLTGTKATKGEKYNVTNKANQKSKAKDITVVDGDWYKVVELRGWIPRIDHKNVVVFKRFGGYYCEINDTTDKDKTTTSKPKKNDPKITDFFDARGKEFTALIRSQMVHDDDVRFWNTRFNRMQFASKERLVDNTREYLFFTKPDLHIVKPNTETLSTTMSTDPFWREMSAKYPEMIRNLQYSVKSNIMPFMPVLTNSVSSSLDMPSMSGETMDTPQTIYGTSIQYRTGGLKSDESFDFSLEFTDNKWLEVYHLFKMYEYYQQQKTLGIITPPFSDPKALNKYIVNRILHDQIGIYKFIVDNDMETILYYAYMCGCFPKNAPRDALREIETGTIKFTIDWHAQFVEDMNPLILVDFNEIVKKSVADKDFIDIWTYPTEEDKIGMMNGEWGMCPYVVVDTNLNKLTNGNKDVYKLKWV